MMLMPLMRQRPGLEAVLQWPWRQRVPRVVEGCGCGCGCGRCGHDPSRGGGVEEPTHCSRKRGSWHACDAACRFRACVHVSPLPGEMEMEMSESDQ